MNITAITGQDQAEVRQSNQIGETISSLQNIIELNAVELQRVKNELKEKRESLKSVFDNDTQLSEAQAKASVLLDDVKARKSQMAADPQVTSLKVQIAELNSHKKEIEESLSNHLVNYHGITNSTSFDTSDGDQWDFSVSAKVKPRQLKLFER